MISETVPKEGEVVFLKLDGFDPPWRQALVISASSRLARLVLSVRVLDTEMADRASETTSFEQKGRRFILVEGNPQQVRLECSQPYLALEGKRKDILKQAKLALDGDNPQYLTASEDLPKAAPKEIEDSESSLDSGSEDDAVLELLMKAQKVQKKSKPERATGSEKGHAKKGARDRYPLLAGRSRSREDSPEDLTTVLKQLGRTKTGGLGADSLTALVNLELLKTLQKKKKKSRRSKSPDSSDSSGADSSESSSSDSQGNGKLKGAGKAMRDLRVGHRRMRRKPLHHVKKYVQEIESHLGVADQGAYRFSDYSKKINWGKNKSLYRIHFALSEILQMQARGKPERASLMIVQLLRAVHQVALDQGPWQAASLLLSHTDPMERQRFGGEPEQLERIASYLKAVSELEKRSLQNVPKEDNPNPNPKGRGKNDRKGGKKEDEADQ